MANNFANNIKTLRARASSSQKQTADCLGIQRPRLASYENGVAEPGLEMAIKIAEHYQVTLDELVKEVM